MHIIAKKNMGTDLIVPLLVLTNQFLQKLLQALTSSISKSLLELSSDTGQMSC